MFTEENTGKVQEQQHKMVERTVIEWDTRE